MWKGHIIHMNETYQQCFWIQDCIHEQVKTPGKVTFIDPGMWMSYVCVFLQKSPIFYKRALQKGRAKKQYFLVWHGVTSRVPSPVCAIFFLEFIFVDSNMWMGHFTHMNEAYHPYAHVMSHIWMSHVTHMKESFHKYEWVVSHIWMSHVTHMNESCRTYEWVVSHMNEAGHTYEWVMPHVNTPGKRWLKHGVMVHIWMRPACNTSTFLATQSHVTCIFAKFNIYRECWLKHGVMLHIWMRHATPVNESCHTYEWVVPHKWMRHACNTSPLLATQSHVTCMFEPKKKLQVFLKYWLQHGVMSPECVNNFSWFKIGCRNNWIPLFGKSPRSTLICEWVMSHTWMRQPTSIIESCHAYEWGMPHVNARGDTKSCHLYVWIFF